MSEALQKARDYENTYGPRILEEARPVFHLSPTVGWMNDPNGFSVYRGEYHLFYQYHPYSALWGPMHWGHVKTKDFLQWERLPAALAPDQDYDRDGCWSGGAAELPDGRQLLIYTGRRVEGEGDAEEVYQVQCLATGDGRDYEKYGGNPVLAAKDLPDGCSIRDFRDPKLWREADGTYRAVTVSRTEDGSGAVLLYRSDDGFSWRFAGVIERCRNEYGHMWECPDFFPLDGKQIILVSPMGMAAREPDFHAGYGAIAIVGTYDRESGTFARESVRTLDHGTDFYAAQTLEALDGRRILIAWTQNWASVRCQPDESLCWGGMAVPRELSMRDGCLVQNPVRELERWRADPVIYRNAKISGETALDGIRGRVLDMTLVIRPAEDGGFARFRVHVAADAEDKSDHNDAEHGTTVEYIPERGVIRVTRSAADTPEGLDPVREFAPRTQGAEMKLRFLLDRHTLELFVNDGEEAAAFLLYAPQSADAIRFESEGGAALLDVEAYHLNKP